MRISRASSCEASESTVSPFWYVASYPHETCQIEKELLVNTQPEDESTGVENSEVIEPEYKKYVSIRCTKATRATLIIKSAKNFVHRAWA